eukprot:1444304-Lingulodinium_polyedra.AAC.1
MQLDPADSAKQHPTNDAQVNAPPTPALNSPEDTGDHIGGAPPEMPAISRPLRRITGKQPDPARLLAART